MMPPLTTFIQSALIAIRFLFAYNFGGPGTEAVVPKPDVESRPMDFGGSYGAYQTAV